MWYGRRSFRASSRPTKAGKRTGDAKVKIRVLNSRDRRIIADAARLGRRLAKRGALGAVRPAVRNPMSKVAINVVIVGDRAIHDLNLRYRRRNRPTDVLSFALGTPDPETGETLLGEVYVSRERARAQARQYDVSYHEEVGRLVLHGILHLLGLSHREMEPLYERYR